MDWTELTLGRRLQVACKALDLTLEQVADRAGVSASAVYSLASGRRQGSLTLWRKVCGAINVRFCWILEGEGDIFLPPPTVTFPETTKAASPEGEAARHRVPIESVTPAVSRRKPPMRDGSVPPTRR